jgi:peptidoglycan hydrolase-like protein with peptidoglycan-binding domain
MTSTHVLAENSYINSYIMRLWHSSILIFTCLACLGVDTIPASTATHQLAPEILELAQANSQDTATRPILGPNSRGKDVEALQRQLKELGYYDGVIDGQYGNTTEIAVSKFQQAKGLIADSIVGKTTWDSLQASVKQKSTSSPATTSPPEPSKKQSQSQNSLVRWLLIATGVLGSVGALLYIMKLFGNAKKSSNSPTSLDAEPYIQAETKPVIPPSQEFEITTNQHSNNATVVSPEETTPSPTKLLPPEKTSRLAKVNIIDELITDLNSTDPTKRRKAIWDLGQQGDSRAIQPLVDMMIDADSQQRSLILAALSEIGTRALKPMNRALAISLQDESPDVRKNAIRDLTRVYDMMAQISQMLCHAAEDSDAEVQATARYALSQMNRIRALPSQEVLPEDSQNNPET